MQKAIGAALRHCLRNVRLKLVHSLLCLSAPGKGQGQRSLTSSLFECLGSHITGCSHPPFSMPYLTTILVNQKWAAKWCPSLPCPILNYVSICMPLFHGSCPCHYPHPRIHNPHWVPPFFFRVGREAHLSSDGPMLPRTDSTSIDH